MRATVRRWGAVHDERWLVSLVAARLAATAFAAVLIVWGGPSTVELLLLIYGPASTALLATLPSLCRFPWAWSVDYLATLVLILASNYWCNPFLPCWGSSRSRLPRMYLPAAHGLRFSVRNAPWSSWFSAINCCSGPRLVNPLGLKRLRSYLIFAPFC